MSVRLASVRSSLVNQAPLVHPFAGAANFHSSVPVMKKKKNKGLNMKEVKKLTSRNSYTPPPALNEFRTFLDAFENAEEDISQCVYQLDDLDEALALAMAEKKQHKPTTNYHIQRLAQGYEDS
jgi:hypothetical protein